MWAGIRTRRAAGANDPQQLALTAALRPGGDGLTAAFQPVIDLTQGRAVAYEGLVRGRHLGRPLAPAVLFAAARASGRLAELDRAALTTVVREAAPWIAGRPLFVHLLPRSLDAARVHELDRACHLLGLPTDELVLEVPAHDTGDAAEVREVLHAARDHGARIALDDARPERRTLEQLRRWRPDLMKVSMAVTHQLPASRDALIRLLDAARNQGTEAVLEGVETAEQEQVARELGIDLVQGYRYGPPADHRELDVAPLVPIGGPA